MLEEPDDLGELTCDAIAGDLRITQRRHGHRYSIDDVMTAWEAARAAPEARRCLELGSGIGSVLLMLAYKLPAAHFVAVEAQRNSFRLLQRNAADNGLSARVRLLHGDLRSEVQPALGSFDLITGTPPYVLPGTATPSSDSQKAYCRQEFRGGVEDYLAALARVLAPTGVGVVCADARFPERALGGAERAGLRVTRQRDVVPRAGSKPLFAVFTVVSAERTSEHFERAPDFIARDEAGARTDAYVEVRRFFGIDPLGAEAPSP
jgi:tRNA1Val (adenine37-N6)-methyltransferase